MATPNLPQSPATVLLSARHCDLQATEPFCDPHVVLHFADELGLVWRHPHGGMVQAFQAFDGPTHLVIDRGATDADLQRAASKLSVALLALVAFRNAGAAA